jgi:hypothetical protein
MMYLHPGDRIELVEMGREVDGRPDPDPILPGSKGTVRRVQELGVWSCHQVGVTWDDGRTLSLVCPPDLYRVIERVMV